ncbi:MAG: NAD(P)/FAD-dependent oxidoreductase [candidate division Zixibacteria bacterium]|nr:NAD(P)/FAD-dependent oxidoreductase [Candidatus Tariuqbacter arcticus]
MGDVIIGAGAGGIGCVETLRKLDDKREITVVAPESGPPYSRPMLYYALAKKIPLKGIYFRGDEFYLKNGIRFINGLVVNVDTDSRKVILDGGSEIPFDNLVIAAGGVPRFPSIKGIDKDGVCGFRTVENLKIIISYAEDSKNAVVLGGGNIGLLAAEGLYYRGVKSAVVVKSPHLLSQLADAETSEIFRHHLEDNGLTIETGFDVVEILGNERVEAVVLDDGRELPCQMVVVGKGIKPDLSIVEGSGIDCDWGIIADEYMMTSVEGIYCAGDVAEVLDRLTGIRTTVGIWPAAFEQGQYAAYNIMGHKRAYSGAVRMNSSEFFGLNLMSLGIVKPKSDDFTFHTKRRGNYYLKLVFKDNRLWGAILVGDIKAAGVLNSLIKSRVDVSSVMDDLMEGDIDFGKITGLLNQAELGGLSREHNEMTTSLE